MTSTHMLWGMRMPQIHWQKSADYTRTHKHKHMAGCHWRTFLDEGSMFAVCIDAANTYTWQCKPWVYRQTARHRLGMHYEQAFGTCTFVRIAPSVHSLFEPEQALLAAPHLLPYQLWCMHPAGCREAAACCCHLHITGWAALQRCTHQPGSGVVVKAVIKPLSSASIIPESQELACQVPARGRLGHPNRHPGQIRPLNRVKSLQLYWRLYAKNERHMQLDLHF